MTPGTSGRTGTGLGRVLFLMAVFSLANAGYWIPDLLSLLRGLFFGDNSAAFVSRDFVNYWMSGRLVLTGQTSLLFQPEGYQSALETSFGLSDLEPRHWSYPPHMLLLTAPLGLLPFGAAYVLFQLLTGAVFAGGIVALAREQGLAGQIVRHGAEGARAFTQKLVLQTALLMVPFAVHVFATGQNGFLFGGVILYALAFRKTRPVVAGLMLAVLTMKPQLGLLFPLLLLLERNYAAIIWTAVFTSALLCLTTVCFGPDVWRGLFESTLGSQTAVAMEGRGRFLMMMPTWFGVMRANGLDPNAAAIGHTVLALVVLSVWYVASRHASGQSAQTRLALPVVFLLTPYAFTYDLGPVLAVAALGLSGVQDRSGSEARFSRWILPAGLGLLMALPLWMPPVGFGPMAVWLAPIVVTGVFLFETVQVTEISAVLANRRRHRRAAVDSREHLSS